MQEYVLIGLTFVVGMLGIYVTIVWSRAYKAQLLKNDLNHLLTSKMNFTTTSKGFPEIVKRLQSMEKSDAAFVETVLNTLLDYRFLVEEIKSISSQSDLHSANEKIILAAGKLIGAESIHLLLCDHNKKELKYEVSYHEKVYHEKDCPSNIPLSAKSVVCAVAREAKVINLDITSQNESELLALYPETMDVARHPGLCIAKPRHILCVPVIGENKKVVAVIKAINCLRRVPVHETIASLLAGNRETAGGFSFEDEFILSIISEFSGNVLHRINLLNSALLAKKQSDLLRKKLEKFITMIDSVNAEMDPAKVLDSIIRVSYEILDMERITILVVDKDRKHLTFGFSKDINNISIPIGEGIAGCCAQTGETIVVDDVYQDPRFNPEIDKHTGYTTRNVLCIPIKDSDNKVVAVIQAVNKLGGRKINKDDVHILGYVAANAGITLKKAQMFHTTLRAQRTTQAILKIAKGLNNEMSIDEFHYFVIGTIYPLLNCQRVTLYTVDDVTQEVVIAVSKFEHLAGMRMKFGKGIAGMCALTGKTINIKDAYKQSYFNSDFDKKEGFVTKSVLCVPIFAGNVRSNGSGSSHDDVVGVIQAINKVDLKSETILPFDDEDEEALVALCSELGRVMKQKNLEALYYSALNGGDSSSEEGVLDRHPGFLGSLLKDECLQTSVVSPRDIQRKSLWVSPRSMRLSVKSSSLPVIVHAEEAEARLGNPDFDSLEMDDSMFVQLCVMMYKEFNLLNKLKISEEGLVKFITAISGKYQKNPYHNFNHGFSCAHAVYLTIANSKVNQYLGNLDVFAALTAAIAHDVDHPGVNNDYLVKTRDERAMTFSDDSVLERHHIRVLFQTANSNGVSDPKNIFSGFTDEQYKEVRKTIIQAILGTDMKFCIDHMKKLDAYGSKSFPIFDRDVYNDRQFLVEILVQLGDLSGQTLKTDLAVKWGNLCLEEFNKQTELEELNKVTVSTWMRNTTEASKMNAQANFIVRFVMPLFKSFASLFPDPCNVSRVEKCEKNLQYYQNQYEIETKAAAATAVNEMAASVTKMVLGRNTSFVDLNLPRRDSTTFSNEFGLSSTDIDTDIQIVDDEADVD